MNNQLRIQLEVGVSYIPRYIDGNNNKDDSGNGRFKYYDFIFSQPTKNCPKYV